MVGTDKEDCMMRAREENGYEKDDRVAMTCAEAVAEEVVTVVFSTN